MGDVGEHAVELARFRNAVETLGVSTKGVDDATCMRFLRGRSLHIEKAARMYAQYCTWRESFVPLGYIPEEQVISELKAGKIALAGHSKKGLPVMVFLGSKHYPNRTDFDTYKRFFVHIIDKAVASAPLGVEKVIVIVDLSHFCYKNVDIKGAIAAFQILQNYYPERLDTIYMVKVPKFFRGVWKMIAFCLEKSTKEKVVFLDDGNITEVLLLEVDAASLPSMYGGKSELVLLQDAHLPNCFESAVAST